MRVALQTPLAPLTTLGLGGRARAYQAVTDPAEAVEALRAHDASGEPLLVLGGGSNVVIADTGFEGTVLHQRTTGYTASRHRDLVDLTIQAGHVWDDLVAATVAEGLVGLECLSGIPGSVGATPIQNVGAYGYEIAELLQSVTAYDRHRGELLTLPASACGFAYRQSLFKTTDRYVILAVVLRLRRGTASGPLRYRELTGALGLAEGESAPLGDVRDAVLTLRRRKGMVVDPADPESRSVGSFFTNPILTAEAWDDLRRRVAGRLGSGVVPPSWTLDDGRVKTSAAWLIEQAGFGRGYGDGPVGISRKHTLALVHRGGGTTAALLALASDLRHGVEAAFGVRLTNEPVLVGVEW